jgi:hypothetical protein
MTNMWNNTLNFNEKGEVILSDKKKGEEKEKKKLMISYDDRLKRIWREKRKIDYEQENNKFKQWCNTPLDFQNSNKCFGDVLESLYNDTLESLSKDRYYIKNKEFKDEFATLIYNESIIYAQKKVLTDIFTR